jgi:hypothetical protein
MGQLGCDGLRLAAYSGDLEARAILGAAAPERPAKSKAWFLGLAAFEKPVAVRAATVVGRLLLPAWNVLGLRLAIGALESAEDWLRCPCLKHRLRAAEVARLAALPSGTTTRAAVNIALAASRRDWTKTEQSAAHRLSAKDCAAAAWNVRETFEGRPADDRVRALAACGLGGAPALGEVRAHVEVHLRALARGASVPTEPLVRGRLSRRANLRGPDSSDPSRRASS